MLEEFRVDNFKSLINVTFSPRECNLLLGVNNAGKSNLCQAMAFVAASVHKPLDECADSVAGGRFGITNHYFDKDTIDFRVKASVPFEGEELTFNYELTVSVKNHSAVTTPSLEVETEQLYVTGTRFDNVALFENTREAVRLLQEKDYSSKGTNYVETSSPRDATMLQRLYDLDTNPRANCFKRYLSWWQYYAVSTEAMRGIARHDQMGLAADGSNLASVIYLLKTRNERLYRTILSHLQKIAPEVDVVNFFIASDNIAMFFEDKQGNQIPAINASPGPLRFLAFLYILLAQPQLDKHPIVMIEEPENGIYVGFLKDLLASLDEAESQPQVIFTSHSPYFVDLFENRLDSIFVMKKGEQHSAITQPDVEQVKKRLENFPLGELHFREMLG